MNNCYKFWELCEFLTIDAIVAYWCGITEEQLNNTGFDTQCIAAKKNAIFTAIDNDLINFRRNDGKDFNDPAHFLYARGIILVEKKSFNNWLETLPDDMQIGGRIKPTERASNTKSYNKLLSIVLGMAIKKYDYNPGMRNPATGSNYGSIQADLQELGIDVDNQTILKYLKEAAEITDFKIPETYSDENSIPF